ncbi:hypothetical protein V6N11_052223 [Hibiscus sabdariffa]|uniref:RNase H type-1 domain-containing protein n=1 Tax=Hibiscus sabdariffa TaxID=183260 RepID=A0ABR2U9D4_9ROSI
METFTQDTKGPSSSCPRCVEANKDIGHIIFFCPFSQGAWRTSDFNYSPRSEGFPGFFKWWTSLGKLGLKNNFKEGLQLMSLLCWDTWNARNQWVFQGKSDVHIETWNLVEALFESFSIVRIAGIAAVVRNNSGNIIAGIAKIIKTGSVCCAEVEALCMGIDYAGNKGFAKIIYETNIQSLACRLNL